MTSWASTVTYRRSVAERVRVREIYDDEGQRLPRIIFAFATAAGPSSSALGSPHDMTSEGR